MTIAFAEVADRVYVLRHPLLDVNVTLVVGDGAALLVDTLSTAAQAAELAVAARQLTTAPWTIVNTHHHFDHCFGNATLAGDLPVAIYAHEETIVNTHHHFDHCFGNATLAGDLPVAIYAHEETARLLADDAAGVRRRAYEEMLPTEPALAAELAGTAILAPTHPVHLLSTVDVGGRRVDLHHLGRGHTAGDLVAHVPDADVVVAGDLVEQSGPPAFEESYPLEWPETLTALLRLTGEDTLVVPGHGAPVGVDFVHEQHTGLTALAWLIRDGHADGAAAAALAMRSAYGPAVALPAIERGYAELSNRT
ncbi:MBL fold metallo-hydrolase [Polymorphospora sp. 2-325]|uniref:MBL fold metallo-hydrolase n=1 Tax=Polymorphospora lycopeni TaxID=3140240 RepID=A0ABV5D2S6_9ACTN